MSWALFCDAINKFKKCEFNFKDNCYAMKQFLWFFLNVVRKIIQIENIFNKKRSKRFWEFEMYSMIRAPYKFSTFQMVCSVLASKWFYTCLHYRIGTHCRTSATICQAQCKTNSTFRWRFEQSCGLGQCKVLLQIFYCFVAQQAKSILLTHTGHKNILPWHSRWISISNHCRSETWTGCRTRYDWWRP